MQMREKGIKTTFNELEKKNIRNSNAVEMPTKQNIVMPKC